MDQRVSFVTLAVADTAASRRFYVDALGWRPVLDVPGEVLMFQVADKVIDASALQAGVLPKWSFVTLHPTACDFRLRCSAIKQHSRQRARSANYSSSSALVASLQRSK